MNLSIRTSGRSGRRRETLTPPVVIMRAVITLAVTAGVIWLAASVYNGVPLKGYVTYYVDVPEVGALVPHDPVRSNGVQLGQVLAESVTPAGQARLQLQLAAGTRLPADTQVEIGANGLVGARYINLIQGRSSQKLSPGSTLKAGPLAYQWDVPELLSVVDKPTRSSLKIMIRQLGVGLLGRGNDLNTALGDLAPAVPALKSVADTVLARGDAAALLLPDLNSASTALANSRTQLAALLAPTASALQPFITERQAVRDTLSNAANALPTARTGLSAGSRLVSAASLLAHNVADTLPTAPAGLSALNGMLLVAPPALHQTTRLLQEAQPGIPAALRITSALSPLLPQLSTGLPQISQALREVTPYGCNVIAFGVVFRSMTAYGGVGTGPNGPAGEFRAEVTPPGGADLIGARGNPGTRVGYPAPCTFLPHAYPGSGPTG